MVKLIPTTAEHIQALYGKQLPVTVTGWTGIDENGVWGIGAIYVEGGRTVLTFRVTEAARENMAIRTKAILVGARRLLAEAAKTKLPVHTRADPRYPRSTELVEHLGFHLTDEGIHEWTISA